MNHDQYAPLAEKLRPKNLNDVVGQAKVVDLLKKLIKNKQLTSLIFWGPAGTGKTTLARIVASALEADFIEISAVSAKKSDVEKVIERARTNWNLKIRTILFVDEIHRFNKAQQDAFLPHVESGLITLIGATTENPSFEVISPLLSRLRVLVLEQLSNKEIEQILQKAITVEKLNKRLDKEVIHIIAQLANGDARKALGILGLARSLAKNHTITKEIVALASGKNLARYDKNADIHFDTISAFIKSMRAGDSKASLYYLARMIQAGEDPKFIARRMIIFASEDIGLSGNGALGLAVDAFNAVERVGLPEGGIILSHVVLALTKAKKSRQSYDLWRKAEDLAKKFPDAEIPLHIRNAPTNLMKNLGYNKGYEWSAGFNHKDGYLPADVADFLDKN